MSSSLKRSVRSKKSQTKLSQSSRGSIGFVDLSPVAEHDEDGADIFRDRITGLQHQRRLIGDANNQFRSLDHDAYRSRKNQQHQRGSSDDSDGGEGVWNSLNDFSPPFCKDGSDQVLNMYGETTQHAINGYVESTNAQRIEEDELLNRAIERREMLHNRIAAIEVAKAEFDSSSSNHDQQQQQSLEKERKKSKKKKKHHRHESFNSLSSASSSSSPGRPFDEAPQHQKRSGRRKAFVVDDRRMDALSERIKKDASEFMNFDSKFADQHLFDGDRTDKKFAEQHLFDEEDHHQLYSKESGDSDFFDNGSSIEGHGDVGSLFPDAHDIDSDESNTQLPTLSEEESQCSASDILTTHSSDSNMDSALSGAPTPSQLSRYSNMVRLGIPDVAVLRSMERDEITTPELVLQSLKNDHNAQQGSVTTLRPPSISPRQTEMKHSGRRRNETSSSFAYTSESLKSGRGGETNERPLRDDPNYTKYFKMLKAKVPRSWVKRVLEVDGRDARILQLNPDLPLSEQVNGADIDEEGNINWKNVAIGRTESMDSSDSEREERPAVAIPVDIGASVEAELAAMKAKAKTRSIASFSSRHKGETDVPATPADISSAAIAASNARLNRLRALRITSGDADSSISKIGRRRENIDEIRRRAPPSAQPVRGRRSPTSSSSVASGGAASTNQSYDHIPLKVSYASLIIVDILLPPRCC
jgi:hypothetical protein